MNFDLIVPLAGMLTGIILGLPFVRTLTRVIEQKALGQAGSAEIDALRAEVQELREAVDATGDLHERLVDLEERADFTERLLTQGRPRVQSPPGEREQT